MLKSGSGISEDPLWSSSSIGNMSTKRSLGPHKRTKMNKHSLERERMKEEAKKQRARQAAAAFPQIQKGGTDYALPKVSFEPRKSQPNANDPLVKGIESALGPFADLVPAIRKKQLHLLIGIDSSVPGTPEVNEVNFENAFRNNKKDGYNITSAPQEKQACKDVKADGPIKNHVVQKPRRPESPKSKDVSHGQLGKSSAGFRESQVRPKPPKLNMPSGDNAGTGKSSSIKIESILKEMTHGISHPPLTDIQTPVKGSGNKFAFPLPPSKDNTSLQRARTKSQDSNGSRNNDELLKVDLLMSEEETDEDQTSNTSWSTQKHTKLPGMDRSRGLSTSSTSSSDGSSSESDSDSDSSDSDSSHNGEAVSPKKEINLNKTQTSTLNSTHVRTKDLEPITKSQSPLNRKLDSHSRKKRLNSSSSKETSVENNELKATQDSKTYDKLDRVTEERNVVRTSPSSKMPLLDCFNFNTEPVHNCSAYDETKVKNEEPTDFKSEPIDSLIKSESLDVFGTTDGPGIELHNKATVDNADDGFLDGRVFSDHASIDFDGMLDGSLFSSSGDFEKLEEKLSRPSEYASYGSGIVGDSSQQMESKAPPVLENPQQILCERSRLLDDPSRVLGEPPQLIEEAPRILDSHLMPTNLLSSSECVRSSSFDGGISCVASNPSMELDGILDAHNPSIFTMSGMLPPSSLSTTTNCMPFSEPGNLIPQGPMTDSIENNMNIQNSQDEARLLQYDNDFDFGQGGNGKNLYDKSNLFEDDLKVGIHPISNGASLTIKLPLSKIRLKSKQGKLKPTTNHVSKGKSIEQIMEAKKAHEGRDNECKHESRRTVGEKSVRSGKRPADMSAFVSDFSTRTDHTSGEQRNKVFRSISEDDEEIDVVSVNENSPVKRTSNNKRVSKRTPTIGGPTKNTDSANDHKSNNVKTDVPPFSAPKEGSVIPSSNFRRTSLGSEVVNKKGEVTTLPASIPFVQVPLKPIMSEARRLKRESPVKPQRVNGICSPPGKSLSELKVQINLKKLKRIPGSGTKKAVDEPAPPQLTFEIPKRPPKSESESSDMVISPIPLSADNQDTLETVNPFTFNKECPVEEVKPPKIPKVEQEEIPVVTEKTEVKKQRGRPRKKRDNVPAPKTSPVNPEVCICGALRKDAARDTIRLGTYRTVYLSYASEGSRHKHRADYLTKPAEKAQKYIESVLSYVQFLIGLEVTGRTKTRQGMEDFMRTNSECIHLVDHVINHYTRKTNATIHVPDKRFLFLCLRLQSLLYFKLFQIKKESAAKHAKLLSEYFKVYKLPPSRRSPTSCRPTTKGSTGTPSPMSPGPSPGGSVASVGSAGSSGSSGSSDKVPSGGTISIPVDMYEKTLQFLTYTKYMLHGMRLWDDADSIVSSCQEFTNNLAKRVGYLTTKSTMLHVVDYIRAGLDIIIEEADT